MTLLGPLRVTVAGREVPVPRGRLRALTARLALEAGRPVGVDACCAAVWPERAPAGPREALQTLVWRLRRALRDTGADGALTAAADGYALTAVTDLAAAETDVAAGQAALREGRDGDAQEAYDRARARWSGPPIPDLPPGPGTEPVRLRLDVLRLDAEEGAAEARVLRGRGAEATGRLTALVAEQPLRERPARLLALALHDQGRTAEALDVLRAFRRRLADGTGLDPTPDLAAVEHLLLRGEAVAPTTPGVPDVPTSFVGRSAETAALLGLLDAGRCVTVVGPGGVGKTRLVAEAVRARPGPVHWVDLEGCRRPEDLLPAVAAATRVVETGRGDLLSAVRARLARPALVVLDGADEVIPSLRDLAGRLLGVPAGPRLLLTSRVPLGTPYEDVLRLDPLPVAPGGDAVRLFLERGARVDPGVREAGHAPHVERVCRALDGLPLALELAASRLGALSVAELATHVERSTALLASPAAAVGERHGSLRAALEGSVAGLDQDAAGTLRRLAVFPAEFTADAAGAVAVPSSDARAASDVSRLLLDLVARSLVVRRASGAAGGSRYRLLAPVRTWLREQPGPSDLAGRHAAWVLATVAGAGSAGAPPVLPTSPAWAGRTGSPTTTRTSTSRSRTPSRPGRATRPRRCRCCCGCGTGRAGSRSRGRGWPAPCRCWTRACRAYELWGGRPTSRRRPGGTTSRGRSPRGPSPRPRSWGTGWPWRPPSASRPCSPGRPVTSKPLDGTARTPSGTGGRPAGRRRSLTAPSAWRSPPWQRAPTARRRPWPAGPPRPTASSVTAAARRGRRRCSPRRGFGGVTRPAPSCCWAP